MSPSPPALSSASKPGTDALRKRSFAAGPVTRHEAGSAAIVQMARRSGFEMNSDPPLFAPDDATRQTEVVGFDHQREAFRNADGRTNFECGAGFGKNCGWCN